MLSEILVQEAFAFLAVMIRFTAVMLMMPALGDRSIPASVKAPFIMVMSLALFGILRDYIPPLPETPIELFLFLALEFIIGTTIALAARMIFVSTNVAGTIIAFQSGLAAAQNFDPSQGTQSALVSTLLTLIGVTLVFVTDTHHLMIMGFANSYQMFPVGEMIPVADFAGLAAYFLSATFRLGMQIAAPFIVYAFVFNLSLGLIAKLIPQFQVFFVGLPLNIFLGFSLMAAVLGSMMMLFIEHMKDLLMQLVG